MLASLELGQSNILVPQQVLWDQTTCDKDPSSVLHWEEMAVVTPAVPWESCLAVAHRKEKVCFLQIQDFLLGLPYVLHHILPHSHMQGPTITQATGTPVLALGLHSGCLVWRGAPTSDPEVPIGPGSLGMGQAGFPAWEISKEAVCKPHFHLTGLNIFQFQNTHLKITYRNIYTDTERNFPALGIQQSPQLPSCAVTPSLLLSLLF